jgi:thiamine-phosphate pyrophosphorylase
MKGFYFITDAALSRAGNLSDVRQALAAGVRVVQYREKLAGWDALLAEARQLRALCRRALFLINDRPDLALAVDADGVHLGQEDLPYEAARKLLGPGKIIGLTVSTLAQGLEAERLGADYLGVSPIFLTGTKADAGTPVGLELIRQLRAQVKIPLIAIGGLTLANAPDAIRAGAHGLCAISAVVTQPDVRREITKFQKLFDS